MAASIVLAAMLSMPFCCIKSGNRCCEVIPRLVALKYHTAIFLSTGYVSQTFHSPYSMLVTPLSVLIACVQAIETLINVSRGTFGGRVKML